MEVGNSRLLSFVPLKPVVTLLVFVSARSQADVVSLCGNSFACLGKTTYEEEMLRYNRTGMEKMRIDLPCSSKS